MLWLLAFLLAGSSSAFLPIFTLHGIDGHASDLDAVSNAIHLLDSNATVTPLRILEGNESYAPLELQIDIVFRTIQTFVNQNPRLYADGYTLICHSQGGLICRTLCQSIPNHGVHTLISLAGPQLGVFDTHFFDFLPPIAQLFTEFEIYKIAYNALVQAADSHSNMWNDPLHQEDFLKHNLFLPKYNAVASAEHRANFLQLSLAAFLVGEFEKQEFEGGIGPWQSAVFDFYSPDHFPTIVPLTDTPLWQEDIIGLKALNETGRLVLRQVPNITHEQWITDSDIIQRWILPLLP
eukprot:c53651_g1_i1.p1 GENE.c53651_g1_i1~~c53651_g1_i1.p1  ORF type:complete len:293 (+),score=56.79 c53651_g1_i1:34-912(+)